MRIWILALFYVGVLGTGAELVLLGHYEDYRQWAPLLLFAASLVAGVGLWLGSGSVWIRVFRLVAGSFVLAGLVGLYFHYTGNAEFELEMYPSIAGAELVWESLTGATPALAPGSMTHLGLVGLLYTFRHPALAGREDPPDRLETID